MDGLFNAAKLKQREVYIQKLIKDYGIDASKLPSARLSGIDNYHDYIDRLAKDVGLSAEQVAEIKRYLTSSVAYSERFVIALIYAGQLEPNRLNEGTSVLSSCLCDIDIQLKLAYGEVTLLQLLQGDEQLQSSGDEQGILNADFLERYAQVGRAHCTRSTYR